MLGVLKADFETLFRRFRRSYAMIRRGEWRPDPDDFENRIARPLDEAFRKLTDAERQRWIKETEGGDWWKTN